MTARSTPPSCVFCGRPIGPDEPSSGRPPMAAHASCADAALADDRHWDDVASFGTDEEEAAPAEEPTPERARGAGCLTLVVVLLAALLLLSWR